MILAHFFFSRVGKDTLSKYLLGRSNGQILTSAGLVVPALAWKASAVRQRTSVSLGGLKAFCLSTQHSGMLAECALWNCCCSLVWLTQAAALSA